MLFFCLAVVADVKGKKFTLVVDAGHGGRDAGACGAVSKEKTLTLKYALAFGRMVERNCPDVNVGLPADSRPIRWGEVATRGRRACSRT